MDLTPDIQLNLKNYVHMIIPSHKQRSTKNKKQRHLSATMLRAGIHQQIYTEFFAFIRKKILFFSPFLFLSFSHKEDVIPCFFALLSPSVHIGGSGIHLDSTQNPRNPDKSRSFWCGSPLHIQRTPSRLEPLGRSWSTLSDVGLVRVCSVLALCLHWCSCALTVEHDEHSSPQAKAANYSSSACCRPPDLWLLLQLKKQTGSCGEVNNFSMVNEYDS